MSEDEKKQPWSYLDKLESQFAGQDDIMPQRLAFFNCTQAPTESLTAFETRIRTLARKARYGEMKDPLQELMRDRLCTGVHNKDLRESLLHHLKEDSKTPYTFDEQLNKAKSWEAAHNTNLTIMQSAPKLDEQVNFAANRPTYRPQLQQTQKCRWCAGPRHPRKECPATKPGSYCTHCYMTDNHLAAACRSAKDKFKASFDSKRQKPKMGSATGENKAAHATIHAEAGSEDDDFVVHSFTAYSLQDSSASDDKYFTWLPVITHTGKTTKVLMQVDSAATCNTLP